MDLFSETSETQPIQQPIPEPVVAPIVVAPIAKPTPTAVSILHGFRKDAEAQARSSLKLFILFMFITIFDIAALVISYNTIGAGVVTDVAAYGMAGLFALTFYLLFELRRNRKKVKEIDGFYMEYTIAHPQNK